MAAAARIHDDLSTPSWVPRELIAAYDLVLSARGAAAAAVLVEKVKAGSEGPWTSARLTMLVSQWAAGATAAQIVLALDCGVTRSAVIGKMHRLGLGDEMRHRTVKAKLVRPKPKLALVSKAKLAPAPIASPPAPQPIAPAVTQIVHAQPGPADGIDIFDLETHHCRWPLHGEGVGIRYCGARKVEGAFYWYCARHQSQAAAPKQERRRR